MVVVRLCLLRVLPVAILVLVAIKATAYDNARSDSPRRLAERFLAGSRPDAAAAGGQAGAAPLFTDVAAQLGIHFVHINAARGEFRLPEEMGPGAAFVDIDGDGDLDVFIAGGGGLAGDGPRQSCRLYRNDGDRFTDITDASGAGIPGPAYGVALLAAVGSGAYKSIEEACKATIRIVDQTPLESAARKHYDRGFPIYQRLYRSLRDDFKSIAALER